MPLVFFKKRKDLNYTGSILSEAQYYIKKKGGFFNEVELKDGLDAMSGQEFSPVTIRFTLYKYQNYLGIKHVGYGVWHKRTEGE